jgi:DNA repair photolyase
MDHPEDHPTPLVSIRGRGAAGNPKNRFEALEAVPDPAERDPDDLGPRTQIYRDTSRTIITRNDSPDVGFEYSINPYRGCEHGCVYCYARPTHEYLGWSAGLDFETRILAKMDAPAMLRDALASPKWTPKTLVMSGVTDPYQPLERRLRITRGCLEVLAEFRNPVGIITKNHLVTRDADVLAELAGHGAARVNLSVTSLDPALQRVMEPRTATPERRLDAIRTLTEAGIPVGVMVAPIIPGLTDHEVPAILEAVAEAGATGAGYVALRLPYAVSGLFEEWLERHFPERKSRVLNRVKEIRGGKLYDSTFGSRMRGEGIYAQHMKTLFETARRKVGLDSDRTPLSTDAFRRVEERGGQRTLFG